MKKHKFYTEFAYLAGIFLLGIGNALLEKADFGLGMVVAPAYLIHLKLVPLSSFFTFGTCNYMVEFVLLLLMVLLVRQFNFTYFLTFATAVFASKVLDLMVWAASLLPEGTVLSVVYFIVGCPLVCAGVAMMFKTYLPPEVYDLFVKELHRIKGVDITKMKYIFDGSCLALALILSFCLHGKLVGVGIGTVICTLVNSGIIRFFSGLYEKHFEFTDAFPWRKFFIRTRKKPTRVLPGN